MWLIREDASASQTAEGPVVVGGRRQQPIRSQQSRNEGQGVKFDRPKNKSFNILKMNVFPSVQVLKCLV